MKLKAKSTRLARCSIRKLDYHFSNTQASKPETNHKASDQVPPLEVPTNTIKTAAYAAVPDYFQTDFQDMLSESNQTPQHTKVDSLVLD
jgi:hypothetical protein